MKLTLCVLASVVVLSSCGSKRTASNHYYPVDSLVNAQVHYLAKSHASLSKEASIDGHREQKSVVPGDTSAWQHELDVFAQLNDINKPGNAGKYEIEAAVRDLNSNLKIYSIRSTEAGPVMHLKIYYLDRLSDIRKIEGAYYEQNYLLASKRQLTMNFQNINNKIVLTSYSIEGGQKMLLADSVQFSVTGMITLP